MKKIINILFTCFILCWSYPLWAQLQIVCAENVYGSVVKEIGGDKIQVISILHDPNQDPHLFTVVPSLIRSLVQSEVVVYNGLHYDDWILPYLANRLLG